MCDFCDKIWNSLEVYKNGKYCWDEGNVIYRSGDGIYLYLPCIDDYYSSSMRINYCPMCGRELEED